MKYAILLRGINVGGHNKLPMKDLKESLVSEGFLDPQTYIQSGNIVVESSTKPDQKRIKNLIKNDFSLDIPVVIQNKKQIVESVNNNPYSDQAWDPKNLHVIFLDKVISESTASQLDSDVFKPDQFCVIKNHVYVLYASSAWKSKVTIDIFEKAFNCVATARNWNTTLKLQAMIS